MDDQIRRMHERLGIPQDYALTTRLSLQSIPSDLVDIGLDVYGRRQQLCASAAKAWKTMTRSAASDGIVLQVVSAYRSPEYQVEVIERSLKKGDKIEAILTRVAAPGYSEHHSGCALDITCPGFEAVATQFEHSPAFEWLEENAIAFRFHMSFPRDNPYGVIYEPWHWCFEQSVAT